MTPITPRGRRTSRTRLSAVTAFASRPSSRLPSSAAFRQYWTSSSTSSLDSASGFPWSSVNVCTRLSRRRSTSSATRCSAAARSNALRRAQPVAASFAAAIARRASSRPPRWTVPIVSPVAGDSASNVSPDSAVVHSPAMNKSCPAGRLVVDHDAHQVADRDDSDRRVAFEHREVPEAAVEHDRRRMSGAFGRLDGLRIVGHPRADLRARDLAGRDGAEYVALGEDSRQALTVEDEGGADTSVVHLGGRLGQRLGRLDGQESRRHDVANRVHQSPSSFLRRSTKAFRSASTASSISGFSYSSSVLCQISLARAAVSWAPFFFQRSKFSVVAATVRKKHSRKRSRVCAAPRKWPPWPTSWCAEYASDSSSIRSGSNAACSIRSCSTSTTNFS